jgi:dolichyl-phosphate beta-glucosyltransferase
MITVIIALYNEEARLPARYPLLRAYLESLNEEWELLLVDDGSADGTRALIGRMIAADGRIRTLRLNRNCGQGAAVKLGMLASRGDIVLYTDADLEIPFQWFSVLIKRVREGADVAIASRWTRGSTIRVPQPPLRRFLGRLYYGLIHLILLPRISDTNCGLKAYRGESARLLFGFVRSWRWAFNIEHLWLAERLGFRTEEVPVEWAHNPMSKVHVFRDCFFTLWELACLEVRRLMGGYILFDRG